ncbi:MAG: aminotransferase class V-fold PLP-dependent enzyme, partial [Spirochaetales bacterium]|nr:aminotransferase class V-fold PLP-dependent enzyme [Spirochaetales bacterium]
YPGEFNIDSASFSAHKIGGPKGTGLLYLKKPIVVLSQGGGQEFGIRPGTENTAGISALARALELSLGSINSNLVHAEKLRSLFLEKISQVKGVKILFNSTEAENRTYSPYIISLSVSPVPGEVVVRVMKDEGFLISTGSACSSKNRKKQMRVLIASGISEKDAAGSIRVSTGDTTKEIEILNFCSTLNARLSELRKYHK